MHDACRTYSPASPEPGRWLLFCLLLLVAAGCRTTVQTIEMGELRPSDLSAADVVKLTNGESPELERISGTGRLLISQPGGSDRISISFQALEDRALYEFRSRIGVDGGRLFVDEDSIQIWDKMENIVQIVSRENPNLTPLSSLATLSLPDLFQVRLMAGQIEQVREDETHLNVTLQSGATLIVEKATGTVLELHRTGEARALYDRAVFELHREQGAFRLPGKITIFGQGGETRLTLLLRNLTPNPDLPPLKLDLPSDIRIERL